jgi:hypothetical protein
MGYRMRKRSTGNYKMKTSGGAKMKRYKFIGGMMVLICMFLAGSAWAEEAGCLQSTDNWIIRVYSGGSGSPFSLSLAVLDTNGSLVPAASIIGLQSLSNPYVFEASGNKPDVSLACDAKTGTAYILHDHLGGLTLTTIENITAVSTGTPVLQTSTTLINFGAIAVGSTKDSSVTVSNTGTALLHITSVTAPAAPFSKISDTCNGATIAPAGTCNIGIRFAPTVATTYARSFSISSDGGNATVQVNGSGGKPK